jgi:hydrogenase expression/formation protein HypE
MQTGKFPGSLLTKLLAKNSINDPRVVLGPLVGEDAAALNMGESLLVVSSDPVTFVSDQAGWYAVHINANDVATTGATPRWFLSTLLVPPGFDELLAEGLFDQILQACVSVGATLVGGHSEVTPGIDRPIIMGTMLGEVAADKLIRSGGAQEGDSLVLTKGLAIEGTSILARDRSQDLLRAGVSPDVVERATTFLTDPGISVLKDAKIVCESVQVHSMHDITEGGLANGLAEVAQASGLGLAIEEDSVPILPESLEICQALGLAPMGLLASGALLVALPAIDAPKLINALERENINGYEIGQMLAEEEGLVLFSRQGEQPLPVFPRDELARYLDSVE